MRWDEIAGSWRQVRGRIKEQWGKLTGYNSTALAGERERLAGDLQRRFGRAKREDKANGGGPAVFVPLTGDGSDRKGRR
jgi:uncharacterized protein YjbJ (UPF0337 family)